MNSARSTEPDVITDKPFRPKVEALAGYGITAADIAIVLGTDEASLMRDYADELAGGQIKANARVAESLFRKATGEGRESVTAAIFWLKTRARWKETSVHEVTAPAIDLTTWSDEQLDAEIKRLDAQISAARGDTSQL
jgi:hypothetical protein